MEPELLFSPAKPGRASEDVALQIEAAIMNGSIPPGRCLPCERELQAQFRTSRGVVREALRALRQKGLLDIRQGARGGAFVKAVDVDKVSESLALFLKQHDVAPLRLIEFREVIDRALATLAVSRATPEDAETLIAQAETLVREASGEAPDLDAVAELDRECNLTLARMAGNPVFSWVMRAVQLGHSSQDMRLYATPEDRARTVSNWIDTARAIADREPLTALSHISLHYTWLRRALRADRAQTAPAPTPKEQT